jgi:hypothetical protein
MSTSDNESDGHVSDFITDDLVGLGTQPTWDNVLHHFGETDAGTLITVGSSPLVLR